MVTRQSVCRKLPDCANIKILGCVSLSNANGRFSVVGFNLLFVCKVAYDFAHFNVDDPSLSALVQRQWTCTDNSLWHTTGRYLAMHGDKLWFVLFYIVTVSLCKDPIERLIDIKAVVLSQVPLARVVLHLARGN